MVAPKQLFLYMRVPAEDMISVEYNHFISGCLLTEVGTKKIQLIVYVK